MRLNFFLHSVIDGMSGVFFLAVWKNKITCKNLKYAEEISMYLFHFVSRLTQLEQSDKSFCWELCKLFICRFLLCIHCLKERGEKVKFPPVYVASGQN